MNCFAFDSDIMNHYVNNQDEYTEYKMQAIEIDAEAFAIYYLRTYEKINMTKKEVVIKKEIDTEELSEESDYELEKSNGVIEQIIRPTGLLDPEIIVKPAMNQVDDLIGEIRKRTPIIK